MTIYKNIKYYLITILFIAAFSLAMPRLGIAKEITKPITKIVKTEVKITNTANALLFKMLADVKNMHAKFRQSLLNPQQGIKEDSSGELWFSKPSFFKWEVKSSQKKMLLSNGQKLWNYDEDLEQVTISEVPKNISQAPYLLLLTGDSVALQKVFYITQNSENSYCLTPTVEDQSLIKYIDINFTKNIPTSMFIQTEVGQSTHIEFYDISTIKIPAKTYDFIPPKGIDILG